MNINELDIGEVREVYIKNEDIQKTEDYKAIWNVSQNKLGCIASNSYNLIQHREVVNAMVSAINNLEIEHNISIKSSGHRIFVDVSFPKTKLYVSEVGEEFIGGLRLINSYDKTTGLLILPRLERLICANGMVIKTFVSGYCIRHNQKLVKNFEGIIEKALNDMINSCDKLKAMVNECIGDSVEWALVEKILKNLVSREKHIEGIFSKLEQKETVTRWDIYNAITNYATNGEQLKPNVENWLQNKAQKLLEKPLETFLEVKCEE